MTDFTRASAVNSAFQAGKNAGRKEVIEYTEDICPHGFVWKRKCLICWDELILRLDSETYTNP